MIGKLLFAPRQEPVLRRRGNLLILQRSALSKYLGGIA